mmetsp:Transcript_10453/g.23182  ORF Transcript_10453/g.23182 Transcript_10453/m.23182 type:complete len:282 (-) Transcript_10453:355-1200(-)
MNVRGLGVLGVLRVRVAHSGEGEVCQRVLVLRPDAEALRKQAQNRARTHAYQRHCLELHVYGLVIFVLAGKRVRCGCARGAQIHPHCAVYHHKHPRSLARVEEYLPLGPSFVVVLVGRHRGILGDHAVAVHETEEHLVYPVLRALVYLYVELIIVCLILPRDSGNLHRCSDIHRLLQPLLLPWVGPQHCVVEVLEIQPHEGARLELDQEVVLGVRGFVVDRGEVVHDLVERLDPAKYISGSVPLRHVSAHIADKRVAAETHVQSALRLCLRNHLLLLLLDL